jgi:Tfp pilus assembly protein PilO
MKLSPLTILIIGLAVMLVALGVGLRSFLPDMKEAELLRKNAEDLRREAEKQAAANRRVEKAIAKVNQMAKEWQGVVAAKTPPADLASGGINLAVHRWQLANDAFVFRNNVQRAVNAQVKKGGVKVVAGPFVPMPTGNATQVVETYFNYPAIRFPVAVFDLGQVTVQGTYGQITENVRSWSDMPRYLAVASDLQITGTSPRLTGTYNVTVVAYIRGDKISAPVPEVAGAVVIGGQGGGGGVAPGGGGGAPAGPPNTPTAAGMAGN